jgi:hypothetical protein
MLSILFGYIALMSAEMIALLVVLIVSAMPPVEWSAGAGDAIPHSNIPRILAVIDKRGQRTSTCSGFGVQAAQTHCHHVV